MNAYDKIASMGRYGDSDMRYIDGSPAHVNSWEAWLVDTYGDKGEDVVMAVGDGTENPNTGLPEYKHGGAHNWFSDLGGGETGFWNRWGQWWSGRGSAKQEKAKQLKIFDEGLEGVIKDYDTFAAEGGVIDQEHDIATGESRVASREANISSKKESEAQYVQTGLSYSGSVQKQFETTQEEIQEEFESSIESAEFVKDKAVADKKKETGGKVDKLIENYQEVIADAKWHWFMDDYVEAPNWEETEKRIEY